MLIFAFHCFRTRFMCLTCLIICDISVISGYLTTHAIYCSLLALFTPLLEGVNIFFLYKFTWSLSFNDQLICWALYLNLHPCSFHYITAYHLNEHSGQRNLWLFSVLLAWLGVCEPPASASRVLEFLTTVLSRKAHHFTFISPWMLDATYTHTHTHNYVTIPVYVWRVWECCNVLVDVGEQLSMNPFSVSTMGSGNWARATWWASLLAQAQHLYSLFQAMHHTFL